MWNAETRFDLAFQEARFAADFMEFGRSGRTYSRQQIIRTERAPIDAELSNLQLRELDLATALITYVSIARFGTDVEYAYRSSIWTRGTNGWQMRFHQGTPFDPSIQGSTGGAA